MQWIGERDKIKKKILLEGKKHTRAIVLFCMRALVSFYELCVNCDASKKIKLSNCADFAIEEKGNHANVFCTIKGS